MIKLIHQNHRRKILLAEVRTEIGSPYAINFVIRKLLCVVVMTGVFCSCSLQHEQKNVGSGIIDSVGLLTTFEVDTLQNMMKRFDQQTGVQILVLVIDSLNGIPIEEYSLLIANKTGFGRDSRVLMFLIAFDERSARINVGYDLEKCLPDDVASKILRESMTPKFKEKRFFEGIAQVITEIENQVTTCLVRTKR